MSAEENLRVIMLDPHNEFEGAFGDKSQSLDQSNLEIPYWILTFDELEDVVFRGLINIEESTILRELVLNAKRIRAQQTHDDSLLKDTYNIASINIDTPVPYRLTDIFKQIEEILGQLEPRFSRVLLKNIKLRLEMLEANPRYKFMFGFNGSDDSLPRIISNIFRLPSDGKPMTTVNLSGLPSEVINCVASVLARLSFDVAQASRGAIKVLLVCEEAHRYVPADRANSFEPTRRAIAKIAKEGRKYGCAIAVITQRPGELDPTILSQCSTVFAMRLANESDQEIIKSALSDSSSSVVSFLAALDNREAIAFGEGVQVPMRLYFSNYDLAKLRSETGRNRISNLSADEVDALDLTKAIRGLSNQEKYEYNDKGNMKLGNKLNDVSQSALLKKPVSEVLKNDIYLKEISNQRQTGIVRKPIHPDRI
jgi:DNA helicase HerA-like ATPase